MTLLQAIALPRLRMTVRPATAADIPACRAIARPHFERTHYARLARLREDATDVLARLLLDAGIFLVAEVGGVVVGMLGALVTPLMMDGRVSGSSEVVFFVREDMWSARGAGRRLILALEAECRARGLRFNEMHATASSPTLLYALYRKLGYVPATATFVKEL